MHNVSYINLWLGASLNENHVSSEDDEDMYFIRYGRVAAALLGAEPGGPTWDHPQLRVVTNDDYGPLADYLVAGNEPATRVWWVNHHMALMLHNGETIVYDNGAGEPIGGAATWWWLDHSGG